MRIAITGGTGLIGSGVARAIRSRGTHDVVTFGRQPGQRPMDLADTSSLRRDLFTGFDVLIHAAGVRDEDFRQDAAASFLKATVGTDALVRAAAASGVGRLVYVSTAHVYGDLVGRIDETAPPDPIGDYAIAHYAAEQIFRRTSLRDQRLDTLVVRPCAVYGTLPSLRDFVRWSLIPYSFPRAAVEAREIVLQTAGDQVRNFVSSDAIGALIADHLDLPGGGGRHTIRNAVGDLDLSVHAFAQRVSRLYQQQFDRPCTVTRPVDAPASSARPLEYRSVGSRRTDPQPIDDFVSALMQTLAQPAPVGPS